MMRGKTGRTFTVWIAALALYAAFVGWYVNWRGPMSAPEIDRVMADIAASDPEAAAYTDLAALRRFFEEDDGRDFFMLNLIKIADGPVADPSTGAAVPARIALEGYTRSFIPALIARGGHPALVAVKRGPFVDVWGVSADPEWTAIGYMRYRSRRDLAALATDPRFTGAHGFKIAAMPATRSFPTQPSLMLLASPLVWVGLSLALLAAMTQIVWLLRQRAPTA